MLRLFAVFATLHRTQSTPAPRPNCTPVRLLDSGYNLQELLLADCRLLTVRVVFLATPYPGPIHSDGPMLGPCGLSTDAIR